MKGTTLNTKVSGIRAARTSRPRPAYLTVAPEPGTIPAAVPADLPTDPASAYRQGRLDVLTEALDIRHRALAGIGRIEAMDLDELETLARIVDGVVNVRRANRPALSLVEPDADEYGVAYLAVAAVNAAAESPALQTAIAADYEAAGQPGLVLSFARAVAEQSASTGRDAS